MAAQPVLRVVRADDPPPSSAPPGAGAHYWTRSPELARRELRGNRLHVLEAVIAACRGGRETSVQDRELAAELGTHPCTVGRALAMLEAKGWIVRRTAHGVRTISLAFDLVGRPTAAPDEQNCSPRRAKLRAPTSKTARHPSALVFRQERLFETSVAGAPACEAPPPSSVANGDGRTDEVAHANGAEEGGTRQGGPAPLETSAGPAPPTIEAAPPCGGPMGGAVRTSPPTGGPPADDDEPSAEQISEWRAQATGGDRMLAMLARMSLRVYERERAERAAGVIPAPEPPPPPPASQGLPRRGNGHGRATTAPAASPALQAVIKLVRERRPPETIALALARHWGDAKDVTLRTFIRAARDVSPKRLVDIITLADAKRIPAHWFAKVIVELLPRAP